MVLEVFAISLNVTDVTSIWFMWDRCDFVIYISEPERERHVLGIFVLSLLSTKSY